VVNSSADLGSDFLRWFCPAKRAPQQEIVDGFYRAADEEGERRSSTKKSSLTAITTPPRAMSVASRREEVVRGESRNTLLFDGYHTCRLPREARTIL
jgi:hypothetical protein